MALGAMQLHNVQRVETEPAQERETYCFRQIVIHTDKGEMRIELYSRFASHDSETLIIPVGA